MDDSKKVTIQVTNRVREQLRAEKRGGETYAEVITRLLSVDDADSEPESVTRDKKE